VDPNIRIAASSAFRANASNHRRRIANRSVLRYARRSRSLAQVELGRNVLSVGAERVSHCRLTIFRFNGKFSVTPSELAQEYYVNPKQVSGTGDPARFRTTRWSAILVAAESRMPGSQAALAELCRLYWYPLYAFARRRGYGPHDPGILSPPTGTSGFEAGPTAQRQVSIFFARFVPAFRFGRGGPGPLPKTGRRS
jgi:hypothetical protein